jgi:hypothetical protein
MGMAQQNLMALGNFQLGKTMLLCQVSEGKKWNSWTNIRSSHWIYSTYSYRDRDTYVLKYYKIIFSCAIICANTYIHLLHII